MKRIGAVLAGVLAILLVASVASAVVSVGDAVDVDTAAMPTVASPDGGTTTTSMAITTSTVMTRTTTMATTGTLVAEDGQGVIDDGSEASQAALEAEEERVRQAVQERVQAMDHDQDGTCKSDEPAEDGDATCGDAEQVRERAMNRKSEASAEEPHSGDRTRDRVATRDADDRGEAVADHEQSRTRDRVATRDADDRGEAVADHEQSRDRVQARDGGDDGIQAKVRDHEKKDEQKTEEHHRSGDDGSNDG